MSDRCLPAARVLLWPAGAEGYAIEDGFDLVDVPAKRLQVERDAGGYGRAYKEWSYACSYREDPAHPGDFEPALMVLPEISCVCPRPRTEEQDTFLARWNTFGGAWEQWRPLEPPRKLRLCQTAVTADEVWRAEYSTPIPANPNLAFTIGRTQLPHDHDAETVPAYVEVILSDAWSLRFSDTRSAGIWTRASGRWEQVKHLSISAKGREVMVWVMIRRGAFCVSIDQGERWEVIRGETAISIPAGTLSVEGAACQMAFGLHQLTLDNSWYQTFPLPILEARMAAPEVDLSDVLLPDGTDVRIAEVPCPPATCAYRVYLSVSSSLDLLGHTWYDAPEVYGTRISWPTTLRPGAGSPVDLATLGYVTAIDLNEDEEVSQRHGEISLLWEPDEAFSGVYGWRLVEIELGYLLADGTFDLHDRAVMYVVQPEPGATEDWDADVKLELVDLYQRAAEVTADEGWRALDGMSTYAARHYLLRRMGLPPSRGAFLANGRVLPAGPPEERRWRPSPGMSVAEIYAALDLIDETETFVDATGIWSQRAARYTDGFVSFNFDGQGADPDLRIKSIRYRAEHRSQKTAVVCSGRDGRGGSFWATSFNYFLERLPGWPGFVGFRRWERLDNQPLVSLEQAVLIAAWRRSLLDDVPLHAELVVPGTPDLYRGQVLRCQHVEQAGLVGTEWLRAEALGHRWRPTKAETVTEIRARRVL
ncbi:MAG: hypothetical protein ACK47B_23745 [Armatimonadota bacterium]